MKTKICIIGLFLAVSLPAGATLYSSGTLGGATIPDNNTIGTASSLTYTLSGAGSVITGVSLTFTLQGGFSTDLTGYLRLGNLTGSPAYDLTTLVQGQTLSESTPTTYTIDFTTSGFQSAFNGLDPNNTWTLFFADQSAGGVTTLNSWSLNITAVPEPVNVALAIFGVALLGTGVARWCSSSTTAASRTRTIDISIHG
jgi:subtilisin-like proprotein convertase family protein